MTRPPGDTPATPRRAGETLNPTSQTWTPQSWRACESVQQPDWPDADHVESILGQLRRLPPLVFAGEARALQANLGRVAAGDAFLLQAGDCAESFDDVSANSIRDRLKIILQMAVVLTYGVGVPTIKVGRIAGQFAKPRSSPTETRGGIELPSFRGHIVNSPEFDSDGRTADPERLVRAYHNSAATLNLLRAFTKGGFADLSQIHAWNLEFVDGTGEGVRFEKLAMEIDRAMRFMRACGIDLRTERALHEVDFFTSHEALLLGYEEALTRRDSLTGDWYDCSAHMLWIGDRTRQPDGAHVEFLRGVENPIAMKVGPTASPDEIIEIADILDPNRDAGRLTLIGRFGAGKVREMLPPIMSAVKASGHPVVWSCDPMHGNTFTHDSGYKTRRFADIVEELHGFFEVCRGLDVWPGGVHIELTGDDVTECLGGSDEVHEHQLEDRYETMCDPRLNARQSLGLAFDIAEILRS